MATETSETVVFIRWEDAHLKWGTFDAEDAEAFHSVIMSTAGILLRQTEEEIVICLDRHLSGGDPWYRVLEVIPVKYIVSIQTWEPTAESDVKERS